MTTAPMASSSLVAPTECDPSGEILENLSGENFHVFEL